MSRARQLGAGGCMGRGGHALIGAGIGAAVGILGSWITLSIIGSGPGQSTFLMTGGQKAAYIMGGAIGSGALGAGIGALVPKSC